MKIGIALGGGGARGAAHIGVLMELERLGIRPQLLTGASIGGLVGALVAAGLSLAEARDFFKRLNLTQIYGLPGGAPALSGNTRLEEMLEETLGRITFAELEIPLAMIAVDLVSRKEVVLDEGDVVSAVLATMALPVLLPPVEREGLVLVDGGVLNNVPFDVARARGATHVIAVDLTNTAPYGTIEDPPPATKVGVVARALALTQRRPTWQVVSTVIDIITAHSFNARMAISRPDLLIRPHLGTMSIFDFHRWQEGIEAGKTAASQVEEELTKLKP